MVTHPPNNPAPTKSIGAERRRRNIFFTRCIMLNSMFPTSKIHGRHGFVIIGGAASPVAVVLLELLLLLEPLQLLLTPQLIHLLLRQRAIELPLIAQLIELLFFAHLILLLLELEFVQALL